MAKVNDFVKEILKKIELGGGFRNKETLDTAIALLSHSEVVELVWKLQHALECEKASRERERYQRREGYCAFYRY